MSAQQRQDDELQVSQTRDDLELVIRELVRDTWFCTCGSCNTCKACAAFAESMRNQR